MRRLVIAVTLAASLAAPGSSRLLDPLWAILSSVTEGSASTKAGCGWDPWGRATAQPQQSEEGCGWDPYGGCNSDQP